MMQNSAENSSPLSLPGSLPGFNLDKGLKLLNSNTQLFTRLLKEFYYKYRIADEQLQQYLFSGDIKAARLLVHTLKGLAANLAAGDLYRAANALEKVLEKKLQPETDNKHHHDAEFADVQTALLYSMHGLSTWLDSHKTKNMHHYYLIKAKPPSDAHNTIESLIQSLFQQLQFANPQSIDFLAELQQAIVKKYPSYVLNSYLLELELELDRFQFGAANLILTNIQQEIIRLQRSQRSMAAV